MNPLVFYFFFGGGGTGEVVFSPSLDFSDARNSQHYIMGWWI